jgi:hypothetical protein
MLNNGAINWTFKLKEVAALSIVKVQYAAVKCAGQSVVLFRQLMQDAYKQQRGAIAIYEDEILVKLANNPMASNMTKRIDIKHHCIRELVYAKTIVVVSVGWKSMLADRMTKALPELKHVMVFKRCMGAAPNEG